KTEVFHFTKSHTTVKDLPGVVLGDSTRFTLANPLKQKDKHFRYLGFHFDQKLSFNYHVTLYATKALSKVLSMRVLGNSLRGLDAANRRLLYRACVVPIMTYG
ncbi:hypothetical protein BDN72DRAFT_749058, partial [Pluteus cervinus]